MKKNLFLFLIIFLATLLRFYNLGSTPVSLDWDEAALGYNAYSIAETGRDEYGEFMPVVLKSFGDYKPALYAYLSVPAVKIFGLTPFAVRTPSALFGVLTVLATYFLTKELFIGTRSSKLKKLIDPESIALLASFLLAISPWHIQFSRTGFEANVALALNIFTALFFLKGLKKPYFLIVSAVFAAFSIYSYQSEKVFVPLFVLALIFIYRKNLFSFPKKYITLTAVVGIIVILPMVSYILKNDQALSRARGSLVFSNETKHLEENQNRIRIDKERSDIVGLVFDNRRILYVKSAIGGYLSHFDINWLFISGDSARHHAPGMGIMYLWELPFLLVGIYVLVFNKFFIKENKNGTIFIFAWLLMAPIPAAFTTDVPHAVRTLNFLPTFQIFTAVGLLIGISKILSIKYKILSIRVSFLLLFAYCLFIIFNFAYYLNQYFVQQDYFYSKYWQYGHKETIEFVEKEAGNYNKVVVSNEDFLDQSYIFYLFYTKYPPQKYQEEVELPANTKGKNRAFGIYEHRPIRWDKEDKNADILYVGRPRDVKKDARVLKIINYLDGEEAIIIFD